MEDRWGDYPSIIVDYVGEEAFYISMGLIAFSKIIVCYIKLVQKNIKIDLSNIQKSEINLVVEKEDFFKYFIKLTFLNSIGLFLASMVLPIVAMIVLIPKIAEGKDESISGLFLVLGMRIGIEIFISMIQDKKQSE